MLSSTEDPKINISSYWRLRTDTTTRIVYRSWFFTVAWSFLLTSNGPPTFGISWKSAATVLIALVRVTTKWCFYRRAILRTSLRCIILNLIWIDTDAGIRVMLNRSLTFKIHCHKTKLKVSWRNNIVKKIIGNEWDTNLHVQLSQYVSQQVNTRAQCEIIFAVVKMVDIVMNDTFHLITVADLGRRAMDRSPYPLEISYSLINIMRFGDRSFFCIITIG